MTSNPLRDPRDRRIPRVAGPCALVLFGVTGDLATKKLLPAIYDLANRGLLPPGFSLVGFARRDWEDEDFERLTHDAVKAHARTPFRETVWRQVAENVAESLQRGMRVIVMGRLKQRSYETKEGEKRTVYEVEVDEVGPSLRNASAKVNKVARSGAAGGGYGGGGGYNGGGRPSGGGQDQDPWASESPAAGSAGYSDEPPF